MHSHALNGGLFNVGATCCEDDVCRHVLQVVGGTSVCMPCAAGELLQLSVELDGSEDHLRVQGWG